MVKRLIDVYDNPLFQKLSYDEQREVKAALFKDGWNDDPALQGLSADEIESVFSQYVDSAPAFEGVNPLRMSETDRLTSRYSLASAPGKTPYYKAFDLAERLEAKDPAAFGETRLMLDTVAAMNESLLLKAAVGLGDFLGGKQESKVSSLLLNNNNVNTVSRYLKSKMSKAEAQQLGIETTAIRFAVGATENIALTRVLFGSGNYIAPGTTAGQVAGQVGKAGLFTGKLFGPTGAFTTLAAQASTKGMTALWQKWAPMGVEAIGGGLTDVLRQLPNLLETNRTEGPKEFWEGLVSTFGQGVGLDLVMNVGAEVLKTVVKPLARTLRHFDLSNPNAFKDLTEAAETVDFDKAKTVIDSILTGKDLEAHLAQLTPEVADDLRKLGATQLVLQTNPSFDLLTQKGLHTFGKAVAGLDVEQAGEGFRLLRGGVEVNPAQPPAQTLDTILKIASHRRPLTEEAFDLVGGTMSARARTSYELPEAEAARIMTPDRLVRQVNFTLPSAEFRTQAEDLAQNLLKRAGVSSPREVAKTMPPALWAGASGGAASEEGFFRNITTWARSKAPGGAIPDLAAVWRGASSKGLSQDGLRAAVDSLDGSFYSLGNSRFAVTLPTPDGQQIKLEATGLRALNDQLGDFMLKNGLIDDDVFAEEFNRQTGNVLSTGISPITGAKAWQIHLPNGTTQGGPLYSLQEIAQLQPTYSFKLPGTAAPDLFLKGDKTYASKVFATGPMGHIRSMMDNFTGESRRYKRLFAASDGSEIKLNLKTTGIEVDIPELGFRRDFASPGEAKRFLTTRAGAYDTLSVLANERGYRVELLPNGTLGATDRAGTQTILQSKKELMSFLKTMPDPTFQPTLVESGLGNVFDETLNAKMHQALGKEVTQWKEVFGSTSDPVDGLVKMENLYRHKGPRQLKEIDLFARQLLLPRYASIQAIADATGTPEISKQLRDYVTTGQMADRLRAQGREVMKRIYSPFGKHITREESQIISDVLAIPEEMWEKTVKDINPKIDFKRIQFAAKGTQALQNQLGTVFGINGAESVLHFRTQLRRNSLAMLDGTEEQKNAILTRIFGGTPSATRDVDFYSKHARLDSLNQFALSRDVVEEMTWYLDTGATARYQSTALNNIESFIKKPPAGADPRALHIMGGLYKLATGDWKGPAQSLLEMQSLRTTAAIAESMEKAGAGVFKDSPQLKKAWGNLTRGLVTQDPLGKMSAITSYATLGFRPSRALFNMMQFTQNVTPLYGTPITERAIAEVDDAYIQRCAAEGLINEKVLSATEITGGWLNKQLRKGMAAQQTTEYMTRAWTAWTVEQNLDEALTKYAGGYIKDLSGLLEYTNASMLDEGSQQAFLKLLNENQIPAARKMLQTEMINTLMGNYDRTNHPDVFRGMIGKAYGKFGVYPINQIELYRKMLFNSNKNMGKRVATMARFVANSYVIYNGFRMVGIDYSGFKPYDPFTFSGGPLFSSLADVTQVPSAVLNPQDRGAQEAAHRLQQNFLPVVFGSEGASLNVPRLAVPGGLQLNSLLKAGTAMEEGDYWTAFVKSLGASTYDTYVTEGPSFGL